VNRKGGHKIASIGLFHHGQLIIQRFMQKVEAALDCAAFPLTWNLHSMWPANSTLLGAEIALNDSYAFFALTSADCT
jgi:hypothetical protein